MRRKRKFYLNRLIALTVAFLYGVILLLLLIMDIYLIRMEQEGRLVKEQEVLNSYVLNADKRLDRISTILYDIYENDEDFTYLQKTHDELSEFQAAYELSIIMRSRCQVEKALSACSLFYHDLKQTMYKMDADAMPSRDLRTLNETMMKRLDGDVQRERYSLVINGIVYLVVRYQKEGAAICGVHSFYGIEKELQEMSEQPVQVVLLEKGQVLAGDGTIGEIEPEQFRDRLGGYYFEASKGCHLFGRKISGTDLWILTVYKAGFLDNISLRTSLLILLTIFSMGVALLLYRVLRREIVIPLRQTTEIMENIRKDGPKEIPMIESRFRELTDTRETLAEMVQALEKQKIMIYEEKAERQRVQLQYFAMQLKPHFYLNSLKTLDALIFEGEPQKAHDLILDLSACLRYLLNTEQDLVTLGQEMEFTRKYIDMQKYISSREISYEEFCDESLYFFEVPRLSIQTFVENSIKYARKGNYKQNLEITVEIDELETDQGRVLNISVRDNGIGYPEEYLEWFYSDNWSSEMGLGIRNLIRRCQMIYEGDDRLESSIFNDNGARAELILPELKTADAGAARSLPGVSKPSSDR